VSQIERQLEKVVAEICHLKEENTGMKARNADVQRGLE